MKNLALSFVIFVGFMALTRSVELTDPASYNIFFDKHSDLWDDLEASGDDELGDSNNDYETGLEEFLDFIGSLLSNLEPEPENFTINSELLSLNNLCTGLLFNAVPHPTDSNLFIGCIEEKGTIFGCDAENLVFDPINVKCVDPKSATTSTEPPINSTTRQITSTTIQPTTTSTTRSTTPQSTTTTRSGNINISFSCPMSGVGFIPHKTDCTKYYECIRTIANPKTCSTAGYHYDVATKKCQPADVAICANTIRCS